MKFKALLAVNAILAFVSGIACVLMPARLLALYDVSLSPMGLVVYQFWGAALIGLGMLMWLARSITEVAFQRRSALALFITNGLSFFMAVKGQSAGANTPGWSIVVLFLALTLGYGAFMLTKPSTAITPNEHREEHP